MLDGVVVDAAKIFSAKLRQWENFYNYLRPHRSVGEQMAYKWLRQNVGSSVSGQRQLHT